MHKIVGGLFAVLNTQVFSIYQLHIVTQDSQEPRGVTDIAITRTHTVCCSDILTSSDIILLANPNVVEQSSIILQVGIATTSFSRLTSIAYHCGRSAGKCVADLGYYSPELSRLVRGFQSLTFNPTMESTSQHVLSSHSTETSLVCVWVHC